MTSLLSSDLLRRVLARLEVAAASPTLALVEALMAAYVRHVPWESAFRIVKRQRTAETAACPRWPTEFWTDNIERGGGGTCFESNYAFFSLLRALGYEGYLTINNMGDSIGCHTAIVLFLDGQKWLVDVGIPLYAPLRIDANLATERQTPFLHYTLQPDEKHADGYQTYQVLRAPHPHPNIFTLIDKPIADADYRAATTADYGKDGLFLDAVIINKVINGREWRFNARDLPWQLVNFHQGEKLEQPLGDTPSLAVAQQFGMDAEVVNAAFMAQTSAAD